MTVNIAPTHTFSYEKARINVYHANKGQGLTKHSHVFSHATICNSGSILVSLEGRNYTVDKNHQPLDLPAGEWHEIEALEDNTVFVNIFSEEHQS